MRRTAGVTLNGWVRSETITLELKWRRSLKNQVLQKKFEKTCTTGGGNKIIETGPSIHLCWWKGAEGNWEKLIDTSDSFLASPIPQQTGQMV